MSAQHFQDLDHFSYMSVATPVLKNFRDQYSTF